MVVLMVPTVGSSRDVSAVLAGLIKPVVVSPRNVYNAVVLPAVAAPKAALSKDSTPLLSNENPSEVRSGREAAPLEYEEIPRKVCESVQRMLFPPRDTPALPRFLSTSHTAHL